MIKADWDKKELDVFTQELIRQVEMEGLIKAPTHMKQDILARSRRMDYQLAVQTRRVSKNMQLFFYSMKVGAAVVAALFLLFAVPRELPQTETPAMWIPAQQSEETIGRRLNAGLEEIDQMLTEFVRLDQNR